MAKKSKEKKPSERKPTGKDILNKKRLELEIIEREWNISLLGKLTRLGPFLTPSLLSISIIVTGWWYTKQWGLESERQRQETVTNLKREFASGNSALRIVAVQAMATLFSKDAVPLLIASLETIKPTEEDRPFIVAVKDSLKQIGKEAIVPLIKELKKVQALILETSPELTMDIAAIPYIPHDSSTSYLLKYVSFDTLLNKPLKDLENELKVTFRDIPVEDIDRFIEKLSCIRASKPELIVAHKHIVEVLTDLSRQHHVENLELPDIDLSGANLMSANLFDYKLLNANLFNAILNGSNLSGANLSGAFLREASFVGARLFGANLSGVDLQNANLHEVKGFRDVKDFNNTNLKGTKGLCKEDLEYAKSKGAIIE